MTVSETSAGFRVQVKWNARTYELGTFAVRAHAERHLEATKAAMAAGTSPVNDFGKMTSLEYAMHARVRPGTIGRWLAEGMPAIRDGKRVSIDPVVADAWVAEHHGKSIARARQAVIYVAARESDEAIKIGWTSDIARRIHELPKEEGGTVQLLAAFPGDKPDELALHKRFAPYRLEGEWFRGEEALLAWVRSIGRAA